MRRHTRSLALLASLTLAWTCILSASASAQAGPVSARLQPDTVEVGEPATLAVTTDGSAQPVVPHLKGAQLQPIGTQSSMSVTNGVAVQSMTYLYAVRASQPGDYTLDGIRSGSARAPALTLHVRPAGTLSSRATQPAPSAGRALAAAPGHEPQLALMRLRVSKRHMYTGQSVPFTVKAYFRGGTGVTVRGRPQLSSDAFTVSGMDDDPAQEQTSINGVPYLAVTWRGSLTAAKAGDYPLDMTLPVSMQYREAAQAAAPQAAQRRPSLRDLFRGLPFGSSSPFGSGSPFGDLLSDPMFDSFFDEPFMSDFAALGRVVNRDLDLHGRAGTAHVQALPSAGRPADFTGAVGSFELTAQLGQPALQQGEPVDLKYSVRGSGNFGQFSAPTLEASPDWKSYAPHSSFSASDKVGMRGSMRYEQPMAAQRAGKLEVPGLRFSYFDPAEARYVTKTTAPIAVDVRAAAGQAAQASAARAAGTHSASAGARERTSQLSVRSLANGAVPGWLWPSVLALLVLSAGCASALAVRRSERHARHTQQRKLRREIARQRRLMQRALRAGDRLGYLRAGRAAVQRNLSSSWGVPPESISVRELDARWPDAPGEIRRLLELADEADYGRAAPARDAGVSAEDSPASQQFTAWTRQVDQQLSHMEVPS